MTRRVAPWDRYHPDYDLDTPEQLERQYDREMAAGRALYRESTVEGRCLACTKPMDDDTGLCPACVEADERAERWPS